MTRKTIPAACVVAFLVSAPAAFAADCGPAELVLQGLSSRYNETPAYEGSANGKQVVVTIAPSGSFTVLGAPAPGMLCMLFAGDGWSAASPKPPADAIPQMYRLPNGQGGFRYFYPAALR